MLLSNCPTGCVAPTLQEAPFLIGLLAQGFFIAPTICDRIVGGYLNLVFGWAWMLVGILAGAAVGLFFHREDWAGGYGSTRRRMLRLAHVSFFGLGFLNLLFAFTLNLIVLRSPFETIASVCLILGAVTMPLCCYLAAWKMSFRHLFPLPVLSTALGILLILIGGSVE